MSLRVVLPSWSPLAPELQVETGCRYAAFVPLGGRPLYRHIVDAALFAGTDHRVSLVLNDLAETLPEHPPSPSRLREVRLKHSRSIGETVLAGLNDLGTDDALAVNMADTLVRLDGALQMDAVYTQRRADLYRWTTVEADAHGRMRVVRDRDVVEPEAGAQEVCVGLFTFSDGAGFKALLRTAVEDSDGRSEPFFMALQAYANTRGLHLLPVAQWFDCGHVDTYYESRLGYQNLRHFNSLAFDALQGLVTKTSVRTEQFRHQVRWYKQVPDSLAAFLPRVHASSDSEQPFITMELLTIPTLSELFVSARLSPGAWNGVVRTLCHIHQALGTYAFRSPLAHQLARSVYLDKTKERLAQFSQAVPDSMRYHVHVDGRRVDLEAVLSSIDGFVANSGLLDIDSLCPIHGDFCFSNLLFDTKSRVVKMIDPRGEFGVPGIYGDPRYDLAKLAHSFAGGYDFIVSDRFAIDVSDTGEISLSSDMGTYHQQVQAIFELALMGDAELAHQVRAIEALLFLSMLPLHSDAPQRQLAMLATGMQLFAKCQAEASA